MVLMVFFSSRISPRTSTVIVRDKSPRATAVVTSAMLRTWFVRFDAIELTESVKSFQTPPTPFTCTARYFRCERRELIYHRVDRVLQLEDFSAHVDCDFAR